MFHLFLIGGGHDPDGRHQTNVPFAEAVLATGRNDVALIVLDEGVNTKAEERTAALSLVGLQPEVFLVAPGRPPVEIGHPSSVYVTGGLTPGYQAALCPDTSWLPADAIYGGFSAGAAIAPEVALVGGWRMDGAPVCPEENGEGLEHVEIRSGLALLEPIIDVHCAQWGNLGRLVEVVRTGDGRPGWGLDEHTTLELRDGVPVAVHGDGAAWLVERLNDERVAVRPHRRGPLQT
jgi:cyanophycinase